tara:strand:+ start:218 stop:1210 length:993 start_codon:yes stop_codon:yes gene_type:complete
MIFKSYIVEENINLLNKNIVLFYGENLGLRDQFKKNIKQFNKKITIMNFTQEEIIKNTSVFFNEIFNSSLFETEKIIFINEANDKILSIIEEIYPKIETQKIYLFSEILEKKSKLRNYFEKSDHTIIVPCYADNELSIKKIILDRLKGFAGLTNENINLIIENCNLNRVKLLNELNKIEVFFNNKTLEKNKLEKLLNIKINDSFAALRDEALNGNKIRTNKLISDTIFEAEKNTFYLSLINQRLHKLLELAILAKSSSIEQAINNMRPPIFWKDKTVFISQAKKWNEEKIRVLLNKTYNLEYNLKSNSSMNHLLFTKKLIVDMCDFANAS